jgi:hypothetical protein
MVFPWGVRWSVRAVSSQWGGRTKVMQVNRRAERAESAGKALGDIVI